MLYKVDIANLALGHLGVSLSVMDLDSENTNQAKILRRHFRNSLNRVLEKHAWSFATSFAPLLLEEEVPIAGYGFAYSLPADCLVLRQIAPDGAFPKTALYEKDKLKFRYIYNGSGPQIIYTDVPRAHGEFTVRLPEDIGFPEHFATGVSHQLAVDIAPQLITNNFPKVKDALMSTAKNEISLAIALDLGHQPQLEDAPSPFIAARHV